MCHWLSITLWALEEKKITFLAPIQLSVCQKDVYFDKFCNKCLSLLGYNLYKPVYLIDNTKNDDFAIKNLWIAFVIYWNISKIEQKKKNLLPTVDFWRCKQAFVNRVRLFFQFLSLWVNLKLFVPFDLHRSKILISFLGFLIAGVGLMGVVWRCFLAEKLWDKFWFTSFCVELKCSHTTYKLRTNEPSMHYLKLLVVLHTLCIKVPQMSAKLQLNEQSSSWKGFSISENRHRYIWYK